MKLVDFFKTDTTPHATTLAKTIQRFEKCILSTYLLLFPDVNVRVDYLKKVIRKGIHPDLRRLIYIFPLIPGQFFLKITLTKKNNQVFDEDESALSFVLFQKLFDLRHNVLQSQQIEVIESILSNFIDYAIAFFISWDTDIKEETVLEILSTIKMAAMQTYEDEKINLGVLISDHYETSKRKDPSIYLGLFNRELLESKRFLKIVDGWTTVFVTNTDGVLLDLARIKDICGSKAKGELAAPTPSALHHHARATEPKGNVCFVLTQRGNIYIFKYGRLLLELSTGEWSQRQNANHFQIYAKAVNNMELAKKTYQLALELSIRRTGGIILVIKNPNHLNKILNRQDTMGALKQYEDKELVTGEEIESTTTKKGNIMLDLWADPKFNKNLTFHYLLRHKNIREIHLEILINLARIDGAIVFDTEGNLLSFGAIIKNIRYDKRLKLTGQGARYVASIWVSYWGPTLEISADGEISFFGKRQMIWKE
ncbi:hypothetical protein ACFL35_15390 [Candidatus Riflebacteria bacterium]